MLWAAHKCVIRGELISLAAKPKKIRQARLAELSARIHSLKKQHKQTLAADLLSELVQNREILLEELGKKIRFLLHTKWHTPGMPLSPVIIVLTLEPLLRRLRSNPEIKGVEIKGKQYKLAVYADAYNVCLIPLITT